VCAALAKHAGKCNPTVNCSGRCKRDCRRQCSANRFRGSSARIGLTPGHICKWDCARRSRSNGNESCSCSCTRRCCSRFSTPSARARRLHCLARCVHAGSSRTRFAPVSARVRRRVRGYPEYLPGYPARQHRESARDGIGSDRFDRTVAHAPCFECPRVLPPGSRPIASKSHPVQSVPRAVLPRTNPAAIHRALTAD
jgi:hypothetical protein